MIVLSVVIHVIGLGLMNEGVVRVLSGGMEHRHFIFKFAAVIGLTVLLATVLHATGVAVWATSYWLLGALADPKLAMLYSLSAMTSYGHASLFLETQWQLMRALETLNGMLLFGLTTAFLFAVVQKVWPLGSRRRHRRLRQAPHQGIVVKIIL